MDREYSVRDLIRGNLHVWWLIVLFALAGALFLGGYRYLSNRRFVAEKNYEDVYRVMASLYVKEYSSETAAVRTGTLVKTADSRAAYEKLIERTGYDLEYLGYQQLFDLLVEPSTDIVKVFVRYPNQYENFAIKDEAAALEFAGEVIAVIDETMSGLTGQTCIEVLDEPYAADAVQQRLAYAPSEQEFYQEVRKAATAGLLFGVIVEMACYAGFSALRQKKGSQREQKEV